MTPSGTPELLGVAVITPGRMGADHARRIQQVISGAHVEPAARARQAAVRASR